MVLLVQYKNYSTEDIVAAVANSWCKQEVFRRLGLSPNTKSHPGIDKRIRLLGLDTSHWTPRKRINKRNTWQIPLENILVENSTYQSTVNLKRRLIEESYLQDICTECGCLPTWNKKPLRLQLDHINGNKYDNRLHNLRVLCPNCHTQTDTWGGKSR